jgi:hypothetical protein
MTPPVAQDAYEPDGTSYTASTLIVNGIPQYHNSCYPCDYDYVKFFAAAGTQYIIQTFNLEQNSDTFIYLIDRDGVRWIASDDDSGGTPRASKIVWVCGATGFYFVRVQQYGCETVYGVNTGYYLKITSGAPFTPTVTRTVTRTCTASPQVSATYTGTITPTATQTLFVTATSTATITPMPSIGPGLWHQISDSDMHVPTPYPNAGVSPMMFWYGQDATGTYDTGSANSGEIFAGPFYANPGDKLYFWSYEFTENTSGYDTRKIFISVDGSGSWQELAELFGTEQVWYRPGIDLPAQFTGQNVDFRFVFDTVDGLHNNYPGWFLDDIMVGQ